jgi:PAS domain S-box-containing protein
VFHGGRTLSYKDRELWLNRDGVSRQLWTDLDYSPVINELGEPVGVFAVVTETTERVLADRRTAVERERQQQLFGQMPGFVGVLQGPDHVYEYVNEAYLEISGRTDFIGKTVRQMFPELEGQGYFELLDKVYSTGEAFVTRAMELRLQGSDEVQFIDFVYQPIRDTDGSVNGIFVGGYEVTEAHRAAAALRVSERQLLELNANLERQVVERTQTRGLTWQVSPNLLGALNSEVYFETSNPAWKTVLGWSEEEIARTSIFELLHPDGLERTRAGFELTQQGQPAIRFPNRYRCKDGSYRWISWVGVPEDGMVFVAVGT